MLVGAISRHEGAQSYEFKQLPALLDCLAVSTEYRAEGVGSTPSLCMQRAWDQWKGWHG